MNKITDEDLTLLYYGEHEDSQLAAKVAGSEDLSVRFDTLSAELKLVDAYHPPHRGSDYGSDVWQKIAPQLGAKKSAGFGAFKHWLAAMAQPRFSMAGALSIAVIAVLAFMLGRNGGQGGVEQPLDPVNGATVALAKIDSGRLLSHSVSSHLDQVNLVLTQFANSTEASPSEAQDATGMLVANRLFRQAATAQGDLRLAAFLGELEPLLIEMAYEAQSGSTLTRERMQEEVRNGLLFRVRVMNNQLNKSEISL